MPLTALFFKDHQGEWHRYSGNAMEVPPTETRTIGGYDPHPLTRHLSIYSEAELVAYQYLQLMAATKNQLTHQLTEGLCSGDHGYE